MLQLYDFLEPRNECSEIIIYQTLICIGYFLRILYESRISREAANKKNEIPKDFKKSN